MPPASFAARSWDGLPGVKAYPAPVMPHTTTGTPASLAANAPYRLGLTV